MCARAGARWRNPDGLRTGAPDSNVFGWSARGRTVFEQQDRAAKLMSSEHLTFRKSADGRQLPLQVDDNYLCRSIAALRARARLRRGVPAGPGAPGAPMVTDAQVRLLRKKMAEGKTVMAAAAAAAMSERSAYAWKQKRAA